VAAKFVLKQGSTGKYRFNLVATNGQVIATSEAYEQGQRPQGHRISEAQCCWCRGRRPDQELTDLCWRIPALR
jgi:hypothetical protein